MNTITTNSYLSHLSAACAWDIPYLHVVLGYPTAEYLQESNAPRVHRCSLDRAERIRSVDVAAHYKMLSLPDRSIIDHRGILIASPELVFLDLARELGFHSTVLLGMQLCASDSSGRVPLTTTQKLQKYLSCCKGHHGYKTAVRAAQYVADNSWSIMESLLYLLLTLPHQYGGYGLKGAQLNSTIALKQKGDWQKTNNVTVDLYYKEAKLAVEYDSFEFHNSRSSWQRDARRYTTLERNGYKTLTVNTTQLYSDTAMTEIAYVVARHLKKRIRIRAKDYSEQKCLLRTLFPHNELAVKSSAN